MGSFINFSAPLFVLFMIKRYILFLFSICFALTSFCQHELKVKLLDGTIKSFSDPDKIKLRPIASSMFSLNPSIKIIEKTSERTDTLKNSEIEYLYNSKPRPGNFKIQKSFHYQVMSRNVKSAGNLILENDSASVLRLPSGQQSGKKYIYITLF
jgi:hypothetical protein